MTTQMVLFAIGPDKPGLVKEITTVIHNAGANLEDSRMASLAGDFALIVLFSGDESAIKNVEKECDILGEKLQITTHFKVASDKPEASDGGRNFAFEATGHDQPGIVSRVSAVFADAGANVVSLDTSLVNAAFHGTPMFRVHGRVSVPDGVPMSPLKDQLEQVCDELDMVVEFTSDI